jgi:hypothetical protein
VDVGSGAGFDSSSRHPRLVRPAVSSGST